MCRYLLLLVIVMSVNLPMASAEEHGGGHGGGAAKTEASEGEAKPKEDKTPVYINLKPAFVTNFGGNTGKSGRFKYIRADVSLRVTGEGNARSVKDNLPPIRHILVMLLCRQTDQTVLNTEGKEAIRMEALHQVQEFIKDETGEQRIDDLLFNAFIVQR